MSPKFYLVSGPEGSTNRLTARLIIAGGASGVAGYRQPWDVAGNWDQIQLPAIKEDAKPIVLIRSVPHDGYWPKLGTICRHARNLGYDPHVVVPIRHKFAIEASQQARFMHPVEVDKQYAWIMREVVTNDLPFSFAVFESFITGHLPAVNALLADLGLQPVKRLLEALVDTNHKHFCPADKHEWRRNKHDPF